MIAPVLHGASQEEHQTTHGRTRRPQRHRDHHQPLQRTRQRLADAQAAFERREYTTCVCLLRVAIDTAAKETVGHVEGQTFVRMISGMVRVKNGKRIVKIYGLSNGVVHGGRNSYHHEAERMLRLIRVIGGLWVQRVFGEA